MIPLFEAVARLRPGRSRSSIRRLLKAGHVRLNGKIVKSGKTPTLAKDVVEILEGVKKEPPKASTFSVLYEDADLLVVHKPVGLLTSTHAREKRPTLLTHLREYISQKMPLSRVGLIHRLDHDASGLLVFSLNNKSYVSLKRQFYSHSARRVYYALINGRLVPSEGTIKYRLVEYADGTVHRTRRLDQGKPAVTHYWSIRSHHDLTLLRVKLETGRKHQIRAHLAEKGHPIVGDKLYGGSASTRLMLAGVELYITHPRTNKQMCFRVELPEEMTRLIRETD
ncbi:MAG: pseudouridine synthase [Phycisphaerae bacterium]|nr:MAG: pseudouridine synthase [Phycisphaerae bacterium]